MFCKKILEMKYEGKTNQQQQTTIFVGADKLEHGIDCNEPEDDGTAAHSDNGSAEVDCLDSDREYIRSEGQAEKGSDPSRAGGFSSCPEMEEVLLIKNLPGCANYGFEGESSNIYDGALRQRKSKSEIGVQVDLEENQYRLTAPHSGNCGVLW